MRSYCFILLLLLLLACDSADSQTMTTNAKTDTQHLQKIDTPLAIPQLPPMIRPYNTLKLVKVETVPAASGTKSVLFNGKGSKLYAMNLEGMSINEIDRATRKTTRIFKFKATKGIGWDYVQQKPIPSFEEKPVEACFSNNDQFLWISLHNAGGIVPFILDDINIQKKASTGTKKVYVKDLENHTYDSIYVPLIKTGATPKIIAATSDNKNLLVSNWHSHTLSILDVDSIQFPFATLQKNIPVSSIPRGIAINNQLGKSYAAQMGGAEITVINNLTWKKEPAIQVANNPRHIVMDSSGRLFVSYNRSASIACIDAVTGKSLFTARTAAQPRTIILSKNHQFLFVTCYSGNKLEVFKIKDNGFEKMGSFECTDSPVGVDLYENDEIIEAWVCRYTKGLINVFTFKKSNNK